VGNSVEIIDVNSENVDKTGFFCFLSKKKSPGYSLKLAWLKERFSEGLRLKMLKLPERGFIEYIPGQYGGGERIWLYVHSLLVGGR
jgi:hypothetical protein